MVTIYLSLTLLHNKAQFKCQCCLFLSGLSTKAVSTEIVKSLTFGKGETLEGHAWSTYDEIFAVAGHKVYLFKVGINPVLRTKLNHMGPQF